MTTLVRELEARLQPWRPDNAPEVERDLLRTLARLENEEALGPIDATGQPGRFILAAGGLVWHRPAHERCLALIHRPRYDDWTLPKGKMDHGEIPSKTARREVWEETACRVELRQFAGIIDYVVKTGPKFVLYWEMEAIQVNPLKPSSEVDDLVWLPLPAARQRLSYDVERNFLQRVLAPEDV